MFPKLDDPGVSEAVERALRRTLKPERVVETRAAYVFLTATRAIKLKKAIRTRHFDHLTARARLRTCQAEIDVNRDLAPDVYLGIQPVTRTEHGEIALDGGGAPIDWVIVMKRLNEEALLDHVIRSGAGIDWVALEFLMKRLCGLYRASAERIADGSKYLSILRTEAELNEAHLSRWVGVLGADLPELCRKASVLLEAEAGEIMDRARAGFVVDGHGDLRPEHVCLRPPVVFDRIEFSADYRMIDVHDEIGYLGLEAEMLGNAEIGVRLGEMLIAEGFPAPSAALMRAFTTTRCMIRARLCMDHLLDERPRTPELWPAKAARYVDRARELLLS